MPTKEAIVTVQVRDPGTNEVVSIQEAVGTTEDDGATVVINNGYVPEIVNVPNEDISVKVRPYAVETTPVELLSRVDDVEANISTLTFDLTP